MGLLRKLHVGTVLEALVGGCHVGPKKALRYDTLGCSGIKAAFIVLLRQDDEKLLQKMNFHFPESSTKFHSDPLWRGEFVLKL